MKHVNIKPGQYTTSIFDLEELGWEFGPIYDDVVLARKCSIEEAIKYERETYNVVITVTTSGETLYRLDAGMHFTDNEATGDDDQTLKDIDVLIAREAIIRYREN